MTAVGSVQLSDAPGAKKLLAKSLNLGDMCAMRTPRKASIPRDRNHVAALSRGLKVIRAFTNQDENLTLSDVARIVNLPRATARRSLLTLEDLGYVESDRNFFRVAPQVLVLANAYLTSSSLLRISQPFIERISQQLDQSVSVSILSQGLVVYVARSTKRRVESLHRGVGTQLPAYCTSMGRMLLAYLSEAELAAYLDRAELVKHTSRTVTDPRELAAVIAVVRRQDYCILDQEFELNLRSLSVPLRNASGRVIAAINVSSQSAVTPKRAMLKTYLPTLRLAASEMRALLV
jgi:IclR family transcriptional regulator, pca regulon regulatory protein